MISAGALMIMGYRKQGAFLLMYTMVFLMILQDNPYLVDYIKPAPKSKQYKWADLTRHLSVMGAGLLVIVAQPEEKKDSELKEKKDKWEKNLISGLYAYVLLFICMIYIVC